MPVDNTQIIKWVSITVGIFTLGGALLGAGISYGQHVQSDAYQDSRLTQLEQRLHDLEMSHDKNHPADQPLVK